MYHLIFNEKGTHFVSMFEYFKRFLIFYTYLLYILITYYFLSSDTTYNNIFKLFQLGGPLFIKIGQNIANKNNIDPLLKNKLIKLQSNNYHYENASAADIKAVPHLNSIEEKPIASGSIATIFKGVYKNKACIIKVTHKNIKKNTIISLNLFEGLRHRLASFDLLNLFNQLVDIKQTYIEVLNQTNLINEVDNLNEIQNNFKDRPFTSSVVFPEVYYYDENIIIESFEDGLDIVEVVEKYPDYKEESSHLIHCVFYKMFFDNCIHADMHFSNIRFRIDNEKVKIILYDFGLVSRISDIDDYKYFINVYKKNMFIPDTSKFIDMIKRFNKNDKADLKQFELDCKQYCDIYSINNQISSLENGVRDNNYNSTTFVIKKTLEIGIKNKLMISDYTFNICNGFILLDDYNTYISNMQSLLKDRYEYAQVNGFIEDVRKSANNIFKKKVNTKIEELGKNTNNYKYNKIKTT
jgi:predicted unusual protein kinase regulating ubiquinone biosynthesis (AarF/ABC1/UbiB family)